jgi:hypothetical protein
VYLDTLQQLLITQLDEIYQEERIRFQQDGAPLHYLGQVGEYLNTRFPGGCIGRATPIAWPCRSPGGQTYGVFLTLFISNQNY